MTGNLDAQSVELADKVIAMLNTADDHTREQAYNLITLDMEIVRELENRTAHSRLTDVDIEFLRRHPQRLDRHIASKRKLHTATLSQLALLEDDLRRLESPSH